MRMRNCRSFLFTWQGAVKRYRWVGVNLNVDDSVKYRTSTFKQEHRTCHFNKQFLFYFAVHDWQNSCPCRTENIWKLSVLLQRGGGTGAKKAMSWLSYSKSGVKDTYIQKNIWVLKKEQHSDIICIYLLTFLCLQEGHNGPEALTWSS